MGILIVMERPEVLKGVVNFSHKAEGCSSSSWDASGSTQYLQKSRCLVGTIRATLESLEQLHCTAEGIRIRMIGQQLGSVSGTIRVWSEESRTLVQEHVVDEVIRIILQIRALPLESLEFTVCYDQEAEVTRIEP